MQEKEQVQKTIWNMTPSGGFGMSFEVPVTIISKTENFAKILINETQEEKTVPLSVLSF